MNDYVGLDKIKTSLFLVAMPIMPFPNDFCLKHRKKLFLFYAKQISIDRRVLFLAGTTARSPLQPLGLLLESFWTVLMEIATCTLF